MSYYIRIFGQNDPNINLEDLNKEIDARGIKGVTLEITADKSASDWDLLLVKKGRGKILVNIERNPKNDPLMSDEIEEFREDIAQARPVTTVQWINKFFDRTNVIYAFQLTDKAFEDNNYEVIDAIHSVIRAKTQGITQDDQTGFMNEQGYYILWYDDEVEGGQFGSIPVAVLGKDGAWHGFEMEMKDEKQRKAFLEGRMP